MMHSADVLDEHCTAPAALPVTLSVDQAHVFIGGRAVISRAGFYAAIKRNEVPHIRLQRRILIPRIALLRWLEQCPAAPERRG